MITQEQQSQHEEKQPPKYMQFVGNTIVFSQDTQFSDGFLLGYAEFLAAFQGHTMTDLEMYSITANIAKVMYSGRHQAGYIAGWFAGLYEQVPGTPEFDVFEAVGDESLV